MWVQYFENGGIYGEYLKNMMCISIGPSEIFDCLRGYKAKSSGIAEERAFWLFLLRSDQLNAVLNEEGCCEVQFY